MIVFYKKLNLLLILFITLEAMDSPEISSSRMHPKYVTLYCWEILISPLLMSRISSFFKHLFDPNTIDLVLSSPKWMLIFHKPITQRVEVPIQVILDCLNIFICET